MCWWLWPENGHWDRVGTFKNCVGPDMYATWCLFQCKHIVSRWEKKKEFLAYTLYTFLVGSEFRVLSQLSGGVSSFSAFNKRSHSPLLSVLVVFILFEVSAACFFITIVNVQYLYGYVYQFLLWNSVILVFTVPTKRKEKEEEGNIWRQIRQKSYNWGGECSTEASGCFSVERPLTPSICCFKCVGGNGLIRDNEAPFSTLHLIFIYFQVCSLVWYWRVVRCWMVSKSKQDKVKE